MGDRINTLKRYSHYLNQYRHTILGLIGISLTATFFSVPLPIIYKKLVDEILPNRNSLGLVICLGLMVLSIVATALLGYMSNVRDTYVRQSFVTDFRTIIFSQMQKLPFDKYQQFMSGDLITRLIRDLDTLNILLPSGIVALISNVVITLGFVSVLFYLNWKLTLLSSAIIPFFFLLFKGMQNSLWGLARSSQEKRGNMQAALQEKIEGIREIHLTNSHSFHEDQARDLISQSEKAQATLCIQQARINASMYIFQIMGVLILWGVGGYGVIHGWISLGEIVGLSTAFALIFGPLTTIFTSVGAIQIELAALARIFQISPVLTGNETAQPQAGPARIKGEVCFSDVSFGYADGRNVVCNANLTMAPGTVTCIIGQSGAGKTTILNMLVRLYDSYSGIITLDGKDIRQIPTKSVRSCIGMVPQQVFLFQGTIKDNIAMGRAISEEQLHKISLLSGVGDFAARFPQGLYTIISEKGANLSGGERQKIAIARALVDDPQVLLLDEPTNNLDEEGRTRFRQGLLLANHGKTILVVTHDPRIIENAELVYELGDDGKIMPKKGQYPDNGLAEDIMTLNFC